MSSINIYQIDINAIDGYLTAQDSIKNMSSVFRLYNSNFLAGYFQIPFF